MKQIMASGFARDAAHAGSYAAAWMKAPDYSTYWRNPEELVALSRTKQLGGHAHEAREIVSAAVEKFPEHVGLVVEVARNAVHLGDLSGAHLWFSRAWDIGAPRQSWVVEWVDVMIRLGHHDLALHVAGAHCQHGPHNADGWFWLGYASQLAGRMQDALDAYRRCARVMPRRPMLSNNMAALYLELGEFALAQGLLEEALEQDPANAHAWTNLAATLLKRRDPARALAAVERALELAPYAPGTLQTQSYVFKELGRTHDALVSIERAHALKPGDASIAWSLAMLQLASGDYRNGWINHEARWKGAKELRNRAPSLAAPVWEGQSLAGKTIFVWGEQGHGDVLQFVRFLPLLAGRARREGGKIVYSTFDALASLLARSLEGDVDTVLPSTIPQVPATDYHVPLGSLPLLFGIRLDDVGASRVPYLKADAREVERWARHRGAARGELQVGLVWTGSRTHQRNPARAVHPLAYAQAFSGLRGARFFSLQKDAKDDVSTLRAAGLPIADDTAHFASFDDTAAYVEGLDLVITVCTSVAHLAGGLGKRTWLLLDTNPHWVWMSGRADSPWYPSTRLYRQSACGEWGSTLNAVQADLECLVAQPACAPDFACASAP